MTNACGSRCCSRLGWRKATRHSRLSVPMTFFFMSSTISGVRSRAGRHAAGAPPRRTARLAEGACRPLRGHRVPDTGRQRGTGLREYISKSQFSVVGRPELFPGSQEQPSSRRTNFGGPTRTGIGPMGRACRPPVGVSRWAVRRHSGRQSWLGGRVRQLLPHAKDRTRRSVKFGRRGYLAIVRFPEAIANLGKPVKADGLARIIASGAKEYVGVSISRSTA